MTHPALTIGRRDEEMQQRPAYVPLLVDLQSLGLCQIEGVLAANDGFRTGTVRGARD